MKKIAIAFFIIVSAALTTPVLAQLNTGKLGFNYYALVRDTAGRVQASKAVKLRFTLLLGPNGSTTTSPWVETQNATTDAFGFVNAIIGNGTKSGGTAATFAGVDFSTANYFISIEIFNTVTGKYDLLAKEALQAVPYAKVAASVAGSSAAPAGTMMAFAGDTAHIPQGWLLCDGRQLDNTNPNYTALFSAIQYNWGTSNHANLFNIPNALGRFLRGASFGSGNDPDAPARMPGLAGGNGGDNVGSLQDDGIKNHTHTVRSKGTRTGRDAADPGGNFWASSGDVADYGPMVLTTDPTSPDLGNETRPKNISVVYIIKL